jgi:hypothetical protein
MNKITPIKKPESSTAFDRRTARVDRQIERIAWSRPALFGGPWPSWKLEEMLARPLSEKEAFVRRGAFISIGVLLGIAGLVAATNFIGDPAPKPVIEWRDAGVLQEVTLHSTTFATETTVKTTTGIFQVYGGVSAAAGDKARIKRSATGTSLCIESAIKAECYRLL